VVHHHVSHLDVLARGVVEMISANGKRVAIAAEHKQMQIRPRKRNAAGKRQRASVDVMRPVRLHEIREPARATDARHRRDFYVPLPYVASSKAAAARVKIASTPNRPELTGTVNTFVIHFDDETVREPR